MIERIVFLFRTSLYLLLTLSSVSIGLAEGNLFPHLLTLPVIGLAYFYLDDHPKLRIDSIVTSILGLAALGIAFLEFRQGAINVEMRILAASHLLAYFTWTVLLVKKQNQQYWWLLALSVLNMSIAASLTNSYLFGMALFSYLFLAVWTLTLFTTFRGTAGLRVASGKGPAGSQATSNSFPDSPNKQFSASPIPLAGVASRVRGGFHLDPNESWIKLRLLGVVSFISVASLFVGMGLFLVTPRIWIGNIQFPASKDVSNPLKFGKSVSGFTEEVRLGDIGELLQSSSPVMRVKLSDYSTNEILSPTQVSNRLHGFGLKFRGTSLSNYQHGSWSESRIPLGNRIRFDQNDFSSQAIRLHYELEPVGRSTLFACFPVSAGLLKDQSPNYIQLNSVSGELNIPFSETSVINTIEYETICDPNQQPDASGFPAINQQDDLVRLTDTNRFRQFDSLGLQKALTTISNSLEDEYQKDLQKYDSRRTDLSRFTFQRRNTGTRIGTYDRYLRSLLTINRQELSRLIAMSQELCTQKSAVTPVERIRVLQHYLRDSGQFSYTLNLSVTDPNIDAVEDFMFNRKAGHCEYFASALTLMLRGVGVPARLVTGFAEGRWDRYSDTLLIEQRHAHAWVEAFVEGRWLVLDPTPPSGLANENDFAMSGYSWDSIQANLSSLWQSYVLGVSLAGQNENIYDPVSKRMKSAYSLAQEFGNEYLDENSSREQNQKGISSFLIPVILLILSILVPLLLFMLYQFRDKLPQRIRRWFPSRSSRSQQKKMLLFFRRFLDLAAKNGLQKRPEQTAREFARIFQKQFQQQLAAASLNSLPESLTNAYYQVRFRGNVLSEQDLQQWRLQIDQLAQAIKS